MKKMYQALKNIWKDESGQGATEYILLLVIVVALALLFRGKILQIVGDKIEDLSAGIKSVTSSPQ